MRKVEEGSELARN